MVLVTRPEPGGAETAARLTMRGLRPLLAPCLRIVQRPAPLPAPAHLQAVLVTSGQVVSLLPSTYHPLPLLTVGDATARRAQEAGFADVRSANGDAADLLGLAIRDCDPTGGKLLLAVGARQGAPMAAQLRAARFRVLRRVVYEAVGVAQLPAAVLAALRAGEVLAALFFSAATAAAFARSLPAPLHPTLANVDALAIGRPAADAVRHLPWRTVRVALHPTQDELLALL